MNLKSARSILSEVREFYRGVTMPDNVEKASRRERIKRDAWQIGSSILAMVVVFASFLAADAVGGVPSSVGPALIAWFLFDQRLFRWGFEQFDLVAPWQFREAEVDDNGE